MSRIIDSLPKRFDKVVEARPGYRMGLHNDINWCTANADKGYHCTVSVVMGLAE